MSSFYDINADKSILFYTSEHRIITRNKIKDQFSRPVVLCTDYACSLTDTIYNGTIYYAYQNEQKQIIVKSITEQHPIFSVDSQVADGYYHPILIVFAKQLLLFYIAKSAIDNSYAIKCRNIFSDETSIVFPEQYALLPNLSILTTQDSLILHISNDFTNSIFQLTSEWQLQILKTQIAFQQDIQEEHQNELQSLSKKHNEELAQLRDTYKTLTDQYSLLQHNFSQQSQNFDHSKNQIQELQTMLESAKTQYNELMNVANQYRNEAIKWRSKYASKKPAD